MPSPTTIIPVCLNPAVDRSIEVPNFQIGAHQPGRELTRVAGGKAVNVARVLAELGVPCTLTGFLGRENRGEFGEVLEEALITDALVELPGRTRENMTIVDPASGVDTHIRQPGLGVPAEGLVRLRERLTGLAGTESIVLFSGSLPPGLGVEEFLGLVELCRDRGARVAVDTSGEALREMAGRPLWLLKPNAAELAELVGRPLPEEGDQLAAAREMARRVEIALLTRGPRGAYLFSDETALHAAVDVPPGDVRNTVGCGDALLGAFVAAVWRGASREEALADAVAAASASACTVATARFDADTRIRLREAVHVTRL